MRLADAGETASSFVNRAAQSNGCENLPGGGKTGYRTLFPLHVGYRGSQLAFAVRYLRSHPNVRLVSLMIGANDGLLCREVTADHCATARSPSSRRRTVRSPSASATASRSRFLTAVGISSPRWGKDGSLATGALSVRGTRPATRCALVR
jgi:hypothetical protein